MKKKYRIIRNIYIIKIYKIIYNLRYLNSNLKNNYLAIIIKSYKKMKKK